MFQEALAAIQEGDRARARDLLTRLLKMDQDHADYWLWMSALVETARERLKGTFVLIRIADAEKITVTREEFNRRIAMMAMRYQMPVEKLQKELEKREALESINEEILTGKVLDFLLANASVESIAPAA